MSGSSNIHTMTYQMKPSSQNLHKGLYRDHRHNPARRRDYPAIPVGNWAGQNKNLRSVDPTTFWQRPVRTAYVKKLLEVTHGGDIWLDKPIPITVDLITQITGLPTRGMDPALILDDKSKEKALVEEMKKKYGTSRGMRGIMIK
jgi:hypothetical protein